MNGQDITEDVLGRQCLELRDRIRAMFAEARVEVAKWTPMPEPTVRRSRNG